MSANPEHKLKPAIIIGTHTMGLGVIRALGFNGVPVIAVYYNNSDMGYVSKYVQESIRFPHPEANENLFIELLVKLASRFSNCPLFPVSDESLKIISKHKSQLEKFFSVACAEWEIVRQMLEKNYTYTLAASVGVPIPKTVAPLSEEEVVHYSKTLQYPYLIKPIESHLYYGLLRRKMVTVNNPNQLLAAYREAKAARLNVLIQELIPGEDSLGVNYNSYFWDGQPLVEFTAQKIRGAPPMVGSPCVAKSAEIPEVLNSGRRILKAMEFYGYSCTEFKWDPRDGTFKLMEVNGRHNLSTLLAVKCGVNFPMMHYLHLTSGILPEQSDFQKNIYWIDTERDLAYAPKRIFKMKENLMQFLHPYIRKHTDAVFDIRDMKPFFKRYLDFARRFINPAR
jgi:D-aspartate ligase